MNHDNIKKIKDYINNTNITKRIDSPFVFGDRTNEDIMIFDITYFTIGEIKKIARKEVFIKPQLYYDAVNFFNGYVCNNTSNNDNERIIEIKIPYEKKLSFLDLENYYKRCCNMSFIIKCYEPR